MSTLFSGRQRVRMKTSLNTVFVHPSLNSWVTSFILLLYHLVTLAGGTKPKNTFQDLNKSWYLSTSHHSRQLSEVIVSSTCLKMELMSMLKMSDVCKWLAKSNVSRASISTASSSPHKLTIPPSFALRRNELPRSIENWGLLEKGFNYDLVAVFGSQSSGKSQYTWSLTAARTISSSIPLPRLIGMYDILKPY